MINKRLDELKNEIDTLLKAEREDFDNMPETFQRDDKGDQAQAAIDAFKEAADFVVTASESLKMAMKKTPQEKIIEANEWSSRHLADANEAAERGDMMKAEKLYAKSQYWLDRYNKLAGNS
ncbi:hypothetical protein [Rhizobium leguminosarum]|uniref:hypothetical protein n=1 Tax=Rhizobium leguminosarum TaxID=384 RepID=UPI0014419CB2|nr:hypothetical protein [Rhizobium leguminosarum]MBY5863237.1 hypothetical protein [Rhizobium leguminosarum]NKM04117.1 hypothetical protein [Rhizobium leguminosarum bv. viciae]